ncbi:4Fe-4S binding protein [Geminisphaera colitermitum]|uniref:4Fe-4S binding protein n=1 Tax=Geminisphaera colitermitum TaxID=1148786 RepID=UPI0005BB1EA4|nr:4Fe-4S binding protein [Geminisphaera colitermitum]
MRHTLRLLRTILAVLCLTAVTIAFLDYRDALPATFKHAVTSIQFLPSTIALASGAALSLACIAVLVVTLVIGRVYCSTLCPLGVLQDIVIRIAKKLRANKNPKKKPLPYRPAYNKTRYTILALTIAAVLAGWGGFALAWLDPYSHFGRFAGTLFRPLLIGANNLVALIAQHFGSNAVPRVALPWAGLGVFLPVLLIFTTVVIMSALRGRLWCNTVCPVGALLGLVSKKSLFRLAIDRSACVRCGDCLRSCKAQCIDLRKQEIDHSRCVGCFDCVSICDEGGLRLRWRSASANIEHPTPNIQRPTANPQPPPSPPPPGAVAPHFDVGCWMFDVGRSRRAFLGTLTTGALTVVAARTGTHDHGETDANGSSEKSRKTVAPPGARSIDRFVAQCTACQLCVSACPSHVLEPAVFGYGSLEGLMKPRLNFDRSFCNINCTTCGDVCPDHALQPLVPAVKQRTRIGVAEVTHSRCIVITDDTACGACAEHCPTAALQMKQRGARHAEPVVDERYCIGCGACQFACPALPKKAVVVRGLATHETAEVLVQEKAAAPAGSDDFAF